MFTSHLKQFLNLLEPDYPYLFTNNENLVGEYSSGYKRAKSNLKVFRKIKKYEDLTDEVKYYKLFVFNTETQTYDVIDRKVCEELTENFGFDYNNDNIDSYEEGDMIDKDSVIYKSTSYDEYMNYSYGRNVCVMYSLDPSTSEDAAVCSKSLTEKFKSIETETIKIGLNTNDFLINLYGDKKHYQPLPKLGQVVSDILVVSRRQFNNQLLFDFRDSSLREIHEGDQIRYTEKDVEIVDYKIYNNNEERYDNPFYEQLNEIMDAQDKYYSEILETCEEIINSGYKYSRDIDYLYKRSQEMLDKEKKWRENDTCYGNLELEITIRRVSPLAKGSKITGRYGNKSVISEIRDDEDMPYTKDGRRVDLILNLLAIINRTTSMPITELFITGAAYQVRQHMKELPTLEEKENELFNFIQVFNEKQYDEMYRDYKKLKKKEREQYIQDAIDDGIYIHQLPMWETMPIFYRCQNMLKQFPYIKQDDVYIKKWGREIKVLSKYFIGHQYILKLKQSDRRGFSARSTGALDSKSLPTRSFKSRSHLERISSSCIRFGEFETLNFSIAVLPQDIALFHALYRTSIKGRRDIISAMFSDDGMVNIDKSYTSRVAEIFNVTLKSLGIGLEFIDEDDVVKVLNDDVLSQHNLKGQTYFCTDYQFFLLQRMDEIRERILSENPILTEPILKKLVEKEMKEQKFINGPLNEELDGLELRVLEEVAQEFVRQQEEKNKESEDDLNEEIVDEEDSETE